MTQSFHSVDKELSSVKLEYSLFRESQEKELNSLSERHMQVQLQLIMSGRVVLFCFQVA